MTSFLILLIKINNESFVKEVIKENINNIVENENFKKNYEDSLLLLKSEASDKIIFWEKIIFNKDEILTGNFETFKYILEEKIYKTYFLEGEKMPNDFPISLKLLASINSYNFQKEIKYYLNYSWIFLVIFGVLFFIFSYSYGKLIALGIGFFLGSFPFYLLDIYFQKKIREGYFFYKNFTEKFFDFFIIHQILIYFSFYLFLLGILILIFQKIYYENKKV